MVRGLFMCGGLLESIANAFFLRAMYPSMLLSMRAQEPYHDQHAWAHSTR